MEKAFHILHEKALDCVATYLRAESDLIAILQEIDNLRGYREIGYKSLYEYATQGLKLSESVSYNLITIARKAREVPKLQEMIREKEISVSNARTIAPVLTPENQKSLLSAAATLTKRELEKEIAKEFPENGVRQKIRYLSETRLELTLNVSEALNEKIKRVQDLVSSQTGEAASWEQTLEALADFFLEKKDPMEMAKRAQTRKPVPGQVHAKGGRYVPAQISHNIRLRDQGQCTAHTPSGKRCKERRWLDIHHILPLSQGGKTTLENLASLCRGHHQVEHRPK